MTRIALAAVVLALVLTAAAGCQSMARRPGPAGVDRHPAIPASAPTPATRTGGAGDWVVTDTYVDPEFGRRTVICMDAGGDLRATTGYVEVDVPGAPIGAPCPAGRVLDEGLFAAPTGGGQ